MNRLFCIAMIVWCGQAPAHPQEDSVQLKSTGRGERIAGALINDVDRAYVATHPVTPFVEPSTGAVMEIDVTQIDATAITDWLRSTLPAARSAASLQQSKAAASQWIKSLRETGVKRAFLLVSFRSLIDGGPLVLVPCDDPAAASRLVELITAGIPSSIPLSVHSGDRFVLAGPKLAVERVLGASGIERADLILPLRREDRLPHQLVVSLPQLAKTELVAFWPERMPESFPIQFSPRQLVAETERLFAGVRLPPEPVFRVQIEMDSIQAAARIEELLGQLESLMQSPQPIWQVWVEVATVTLESAPENLAAVLRRLATPVLRDVEHSVGQNALKQIGIAIHQYHAGEEHLPPRMLTDQDGTPLLGWPVTLLPYLDQQASVKIVLSEPWDSEENRSAVAPMNTIFSVNAPPGQTRFRAPVYPGSVWQGEGPPRAFKEITDGLSNTIALIEAPQDAAVDLLDPQSWTLSEEDPKADVFGDRDRVSVLMFDGSVRTWSRQELTNEKLKAMLTFAGGEAVP